MRTLSMGSHVRANVWLDSMPEAQYSSTHAISFSVSAIGAARERIGAIEIVVPSGGRVGYGLLGGSMRSAPVGTLNVVAQFCPDQGERYVSDMRMLKDELYIGLPQYYTDAI